MPSKPRLPGALRSELGVKDDRRPKKRHQASSEPRKRRKLYQPQSEDENVAPTSKKPKPILKKASVAPPKTREDKLMDQDDAEIDYWEAKLGLKKSADNDELEDGLDDIFEGLSLPRGPSRLEQASDDDGEDESGSEGDMQDFLDAEASDSADSDTNQHQVPDLVQDDGDFTRFEEEEDSKDEIPATTKKARPSIYLPYTEETQDAQTASTAKPSVYVPPAMRNKQPTVEATQLKRQLKGLLNRLTAANIATIVTELETMYRSNPRGSMNDELASLLLEVVSDKSGLLDTFVIIQAALVAALYKSNGIEFAASFVQRLVEAILAVSGTDLTTGKRAINLMTLMAEMYNMNIIAATLPYDFIRTLLANLTELNVEILLVITRNSGSQLRSDDPSALKDILSILQTQMKVQYADKEKLVPLRMKFMVDSLMNLKNNKISNAEGQQAKDLRTRMKKYIGGLTSRAGSAEPLRVSLDDIKNVDTRGKWWLVGASWRNSDQTNTTAAPSSADLDLPDAVQSHNSASVEDDTKSAELLSLAKQHRLNNPIRKQLFITILSSTDYLDATTNILALRLKKNQESEIARVLILLVGSEERPNPYYLHLAKSLSERHGMRVSLQFCLWDFLRLCSDTDGSTEYTQIGASSSRTREEGDEDTDAVSLRRVVNVARFYGGLMAHEVLPVTVLKTLTFARISRRSKTFMFLEILFIELFTAIASSTVRKKATSTRRPKKSGIGRVEHDDDEEIVGGRGSGGSTELVIMRIFERVVKFEGDGGTALRDGIDWFLRKYTDKCTHVTNREESEVVRDGVKVARMVLSRT